jgi:antitoxin CptB
MRALIIAAAGAVEAADNPGPDGYMSTPGSSGRLAFARGTMTGTTRSSDGLDHRRRKLLFRSWHRGMREMDLIMGRFADRAIEDLADGELSDLELLIEVPDRDLLGWITGEWEVPANYDTAVFRKLRDFHFSGEHWK